MNNGPDTGEFLALGVPEDQERINGTRMQEEITELRMGVDKYARLYHLAMNSASNDHDKSWLRCKSIRCREARQLLQVGDNGGY
jgi:hypothetical protein